MYVSALEQLCATIEQAHGYVEAQAPGGLLGGTIQFDCISVTKKLVLYCGRGSFGACDRQFAEDGLQERDFDGWWHSRVA